MDFTSFELVDCAVLLGIFYHVRLNYFMKILEQQVKGEIYIFVQELIFGWYCLFRQLKNQLRFISFEIPKTVLKFQINVNNKR